MYIVVKINKKILMINNFVKSYIEANMSTATSTAFLFICTGCTMLGL